MGIHSKPISETIANHDWQRAVKEGVYMAAQTVRSDVTLDETHAMWALLCEAAEVSARTYKGTPRTGFPIKSSMPDGMPEVTTWQMMSAYLRGELEEMPATEEPRVQPSAEQISRAEAVLEVWHHHALRRKGDRSRIKTAVYLKACGSKDQVVRGLTGLTKQAIHSAKKEAMRDMWEIIRRY